MNAEERRSLTWLLALVVVLALCGWMLRIQSRLFALERSTEATSTALAPWITQVGERIAALEAWVAEVNATIARILGWFGVK